MKIANVNLPHGGSVSKAGAKGSGKIVKIDNDGIDFNLPHSGSVTKT